MKTKSTFFSQLRVFSKMQQTSLLALALFAASSGPVLAHDPLAQEQRPECLVLLAKLSREIKETGQTQRWASVNTATIESIESRAGIHGGKLITLRRKDAMPWISDHTTAVFDPQGDPRWFVEVLGGDVAEFFGFKILDDRLMLIPDQKEFQGAIQTLNKKLKTSGEPEITLGFYATQEGVITKVSEYVRRFRDELAIPIAPSGNHFYHDISFHSSGIFLPQEMLEHRKAVIEYHLAFLEFLQKKLPKQGGFPAFFKKYSYETNLNNTRRIDDATGTVGVTLIDLNRNIGKDPHPTDWTFSPMKSIGKRIAGTNSAEDELREVFYGLDYKSSYTLSKELLPESQLNKWIDEFRPLYRSASLPNFRPNQAFGEAEKTGKMICDFVSRRRATIRRVILSQ